MYGRTMSDATSFATSAAALCEADDGLAQIVRRHGLPRFWAREPGLETLVLLILEARVTGSQARGRLHLVAPRPRGSLALVEERNEHAQGLRKKLRSRDSFPPFAEPRFLPTIGAPR